MLKSKSNKITLVSIFIIFNSVISFCDNINQNELKHILLINSYHKGYLWTDQITMGVEDTFSGMQIDLQVEYMDTKRQSESEYLNQYFNFLKYKVKNIVYDIIIISDNNAFDFVMKNREDLFGLTPIVFCGLNNLEPFEIENYTNVTGVNEEPDIKGNINLIKKIHNDIKEILVITDNTNTGKRIQSQLQSVLPLFSDINIHIISDVNYEALLNTVKLLSSNIVILYTVFTQDSNGTYFDNEKVIKQISDISEVPIYGTWNFNLNHGIVGGVLSSGYQQGQMASNLALRILQGEKADNIPIVYKTPTELIYDYKELSKFNIEENKIPKGLIINLPQENTEKLKVVPILILLFFLICSLIFISTILINTNKKILKFKNRTSKYREENKQLKFVLENSNASLLNYKEQLSECKKMAYLGSLIVGVIHTINTPLGVGITSATNLSLKTKVTLKNLNNEKLTKKEFNEYANLVTNSANLIKSNLERVNHIIQSFTNIALDPSDKQRKLFGIKNYTSIFLKNFYTKEELGNYKIYLICVNEIMVNSYPEVISTILSNLISNSIQHGFKDRDQGTINISIIEIDKNIQITYKDSGYGISPNVMQKIYEPFYSTSKDNGNVGLGMNIVYNLVAYKLKGSISISSPPNEGFKVNINFPSNN